MPSARRKILLLTLPSIILLTLVLELFLRLVVPACEVPFVLYDADEGILKYDRNARAAGVYTAGPLARGRARWRINNHGWNSAIDYELPTHRPRPLVAVIGDSHVEGLHTDVDQHLTARLARELDSAFDVYSFGISGAPLSQYLQMARHVVRRYDPDVLVFLVIHNDFDESIRELGRRDYFLQLTERDGELVERLPTPYVKSRMRRLAGHSAIVRYLAMNLKAREKIGDLLERDTRVHAANIDVRRVADESNLIGEATRYLVRTIVDENFEKAIVFLLDAPRRAIYAGREPAAALLELSELLHEACQLAGAQFIDLTRSFRESFERDGRPFNSPSDFHWNERGHAVAAEVLADWLRRADLNGTRPRGDAAASESP